MPIGNHHHLLDLHHNSSTNNYANNPSPSPPPPPPKPNPKFLSLLLKFIIMPLILSLFLLFLGVAAIALLHILLAGSFPHRRRRRHRSTTYSSSSSTAYLRDDLQKHLPSLKYVPGFETARDCSICLECFKEGEWCRTLPACNHVFHANCVDGWLTRVPNCPICRTRVRLNTGVSDSVVCDEDCKLLWATGVQGGEW